MHHRTKQDAEQGQALVEFALTLPIFLLLVFGIIDLGRLIFAYAQVIDAARQGVRWGIVEGLEHGNFQYLDCDGIEAAARDTPGLVPTGSLDIVIQYRDVAFDTDDPPIWDCDANDDGINVDPAWGLLQKYDYDSDGIEDDREAALEVTVSGAITPVTPVLAMFDDSFSFDYTAERSIAERAYYTEEWPSAPPVPQNFHAVPDCTTGLVDFSWNSLPIDLVDSIEIRDSITDEVVAIPPILSEAKCDDCDTISTTDGWRMYYMVVIFEGMEGTSSNDDTAVCEDTGGGGPVGNSVNITVEVWHDSKNPKQSKTNSEDWIPDLTVSVYYVGSATPLASKVTDTNGKVVFTNVPIPPPGPGADFEIRSEYPIGMSPTTLYPPVLSLSVGQSGSTMIGFNE
jgi:hypothetical protein